MEFIDIPWNCCSNIWDRPWYIFRDCFWSKSPQTHLMFNSYACNDLIALRFEFGLDGNWLGVIVHISPGDYA
ncbi:unnamed protein product, partial [Brassica oleracea]